MRVPPVPGAVSAIQRSTAAAPPYSVDTASGSLRGMTFEAQEAALRLEPVQQRVASNPPVQRYEGPEGAGAAAEARADGSGAAELQAGAAAPAGGA